MTEETKNASVMNAEQVDDEVLESVNGGIRPPRRRKKRKIEKLIGSTQGTYDSADDDEEEE